MPATRARRPAPGQLTLGELDAALGPAPELPADDPAAQAGFEALAEQVRTRLAPAEDPWGTSPYRWVKQLPPASRGRAGVALVEAWLRERGFAVGGRHGPGHDLTCRQDRLEVKLSTLWASGEYTFQAVRDDAYDLLLLLGLSPHRVHLWAVPRAEALTRVERAGTGAGWITVAPDQPADWLTGRGGALPAAATALAARWCPGGDR